MRIPDSIVFRIYGIDVWSYLQFLKFCIAVFFVLTIIALAVYLPTNMTGGNHLKGWNSTGMANLPPGDDRAYVHLAGTYVITFFITFLAFKYFKQFTRYRQRYKKLALLNNFSCLVTNVPISKGITTSAKLQAFFEKLYPNQVASATLLFNLKPLERKIKDRQAFIIALDRAIAEYQSTGVRPMHSIHKFVDSLTPEEKTMFGIVDPSSPDATPPDDHKVITLDDYSDSHDLPPSRRSRWGFSCCGRSSKKDPYMVDSMVWYQKQIDDLDNEIELERKRVEESEDLQESVPMVLGGSTITSKPTSSPAQSDSNARVSIEHADHGDTSESEEETVVTVPTASSKKQQRQSVLWRLAKKMQPDREEDDLILNEPFELSDIPAEADPALAQLTDEERRILAATTALVDPKYATKSNTLQSPEEASGSYGSSSAGPSAPAQTHQITVTSPTGASTSMDYDLSGDESDRVGTGANAGTDASGILVTPTIEAARTRRLTRSVSRILTKQTSKGPAAFNSLLYSMPPHPTSGRSDMNGDIDSGRRLSQSFSTPASSSAAPTGASHSNYPTDSVLSSHVRVASFEGDREDRAQRSNSGSLIHLPIVNGSSTAHSRQAKSGSKGASSMSPSRSKPSVHSPSSPNQSFIDYDVDADEAEQERLDAQESLLDRMMIRVPGWEWLQKTWHNWVGGAPKQVMGEDGIVRESVYRPTTVGFVTFKTLVASNNCANSGYLSKSLFKWRVEFAPAESDIQWRNMRLGWWQQWIRYLIMVGVVCVLIIFWGVPTGIIAQWGNIDHLENMSWSHDAIVWLKTLGPAVMEMVSRISPTLTLLIFMNLLVPVIRVLFDYVERPFTKSGQEMKVFRVYYAFLLFNVLFLSTLTSQISNIVAELIRNPSNTVTDIARTLGQTLPTYGAFFINYILNAAFLSGAMGLPRLMFFLFHFVQLKFAKSPSEIERIKKESVGGFEYDYQYAAHLNIFTIALAYSSMVPLIIPTALLYFVLWFAIDKYNLLFAYDDCFDRSGAWTPLVFRRVFAAIGIFHFAMFGTFLVKQNYIASGLIIPLFIFDLMVHWYAINTFAHRSQYVPLDEATRYPHTAYQLGLEDGYIHPAMHDLPDSLYSTRYETRQVDQGVGQDVSKQEIQDVPLRFHPSLAKASGAAYPASSNRKRIAKSLGDELGLAEE